MRNDEKEKKGQRPKADGDAHLIGSAYQGSPTREKALVFAYAGGEYLVPVTNAWDGSRVIESVVHLDCAECVTARPGGTSCIGKMKRSKEISPTARVALRKAVEDWFLPERGYKVKIIPFAKE